MKEAPMYTSSLALLNDLYQLTMSYAYWKSKKESTEAVFHLFFRKLPFHGGYVVAAGLESAIEYLNSFHFDQSDLEYLATLKNPADDRLLPDEFLEYLSTMKFSCDVDAVPEGTVIFPYEPILKIQGPLIQCQLFETPLLNLINFSSLIATKASRICLAAKGEPVMEFGVRRAQGIDGALTASRSAFVGGCESTSNLLAGKRYGIPVRGTHSHSWVMAFEDEEDSFQKFAEAFPDNSVFLVDTYDTVAGLRKAVRVAKKIRSMGKKFLGIRLDSGDLAYLSIVARRLLDEAGFYDASIVASNELDEILISDLKKQGATIGVWGVGTNLVTAKDHPALDGVYKLSAVKGSDGQWVHKIKLSEQMVKVTNPGILQVKRFYGEGGYETDMIFDELIEPRIPYEIVDPLDPTRHKYIHAGVKHKDLLEPIFRKGKQVYRLPTLEDIQKKTRDELSHLHSGVKRFLNPHQYVVGLEKNMYDFKVNLIKSIRLQINKDRSNESFTDS